MKIQDTNKSLKENEYDVIVVGSGVCGATIAKELSKQRKKVLILEQGANTPLKESLWGVASISEQVSVGEKLNTLRLLTTGGTTGLYFAAADLPPLDSFLSLGIDLSKELEEAQKELPLSELPDELLGDQVFKLRESAMEVGHPMKKKLMLIDQSKCNSSYSFDAKWKARSYVQEAINEGATLINQAKVHKVLVEKNKAIGVEYQSPPKKRGSKIYQTYGTKIILAAGSLASPKILRDSGVKGIADRGIYCEPGFAMFGLVPGLKGKETFMGSMSTDYVGDIMMGDANIHWFFYRIMVLSKLKFKHLLSYPKSIGIGVKIKDGLGGGIQEDGHYYKQLTKEEFKKLKKGEEAATKILKNAGAKNIFNSGIDSAGHVGGMIRIQEHVDEKLQTKYNNLYVCDGSVIPENVRLCPVVTLVCLGKYLAKHLLTSL